MSRPKPHNPFPTPKGSRLHKDSYIVEFIGGDLDGRTQKVPLPKKQNTTNRIYINKSQWQKSEEGWLKFDNWYVAEKVCHPKIDQVIRYVHNVEGTIRLQSISPHFV